MDLTLILPFKEQVKGASLHLSQTEQKQNKNNKNNFPAERSFLTHHHYFIHPPQFNVRVD